MKPKVVKNIHSAISLFERTWQDVLLLRVLREEAFTRGQHLSENPVEVK